MDPVDYEYRPIPSAPSMDICMHCSYPINNPSVRFPCGCEFHIHQECIPVWRAQNHTCSKCSRIIINVVPEAQVRAIQVYDRRQQALQALRRHNDSMCRILLCCAVFIVLSGGVLVFLIVPWRRLLE